MVATKTAEILRYSSVEIQPILNRYSEHKYDLPAVPEMVSMVTVRVVLSGSLGAGLNTVTHTSTPPTPSTTITGDTVAKPNITSARRDKRVQCIIFSKHIIICTKCFA